MDQQRVRFSGIQLRQGCLWKGVVKDVSVAVVQPAAPHSRQSALQHPQQRRQLQKAAQLHSAAAKREGVSYGLCAGVDPQVRWKRCPQLPHVRCAGGIEANSVSTGLYRPCEASRAPNSTRHAHHLMQRPP
jgi:hypothetical protein